jgi:hypothetical protein
MRVAALPTVIVGAVLRATPVRPVHVKAASPESAPSSPGSTPSDEQEQAGDEFIVRLAPDEVGAASERALSSRRGDLSLSRRQKPACPVLRLQDGATREFYFRDTCDGVGSRILDVVGALISAEKMNLRFAGVVTGDEQCKGSHDAMIVPAMQAFFGFADAFDMYVDTLPNETQCFPSLGDLQNQLDKGAIGDGAHVCLDKGEGLGDVIVGSQISPTILVALRSRGTPLMQMPLTHFRPDTFNVAVHVRRDDVFSGSSAGLQRFTTDKWYVWLMDIMRGKVPHAEFHVFSSLGSRGLHRSEDFDVYRNWGAAVHLDTEARETMAYMARADVLVTAKSTFSYVSALLNPNCVLFQRWKRKMLDWVELPLTRQGGINKGEVLTDQIASCMQRGSSIGDLVMKRATQW